MGYSSEELKAVVKSKKQAMANAWPVENVDYHLIRVKPGQMAYSGWVYSAESKGYLTKQRLIDLFSKLNSGETKPNPTRKNIWSSWYVYPGPRPSKKWGPVCP